MTFSTSRSTRASRSRSQLATVPAKRQQRQQIPQSRVATSQLTKPFWEAVKDRFGFDAPDSLSVGQVQAINRMAHSVEIQRAMLTAYATKAKQIAANITGMESERADLIKEMRPMLGQTDKALSQSAIEAAKDGAGRRLITEKTKAGLFKLRAESDADVKEVQVQHGNDIKLVNMDLEARLRQITLGAGVQAQNLGHKYKIAEMDLVEGNQMRMAATEQARISAQNKRKEKTGLMKLLGSW
jgi:hypothetical protein